MDRIIEIQDQELQVFLKGLIDRELHGHWRNKPYKLRVCVDGYSAKFKINESTWSPPLGHLDPACREAQRSCPEERQ